MDWEQAFLTALKESRPAWDEPPQWRAALALWEGLAPAEAAALDGVVLNMIDEDYRNPHSSQEAMPFDDVTVNLPAGLTADDLLCIEAAVMVAAERGLAPALFKFNRLMRAPRWHALLPRLQWLNYEGFDAQRRLAGTVAGRCLGALLGLVVGDALRPGPDGGLEAGTSGPAAALALTFAADPSAPVRLPDPPDEAGPAGFVALAIPLALAGVPAGPEPDAPPGLAAVAAGQAALAALLAGGSREAAAAQGEALLRETAPDHPAVQMALVALAALSRSSSFEEAVTAAGPARALAGGLAGACYGPHGIPRRWSTVLRDRDRLDELAEKLFLEAQP